MDLTHPYPSEEGNLYFTLAPHAVPDLQSGTLLPADLQSASLSVAAAFAIADYKSAAIILSDCKSERAKWAEMSDTAHLYTLYFLPQSNYAAM